MPDRIEITDNVSIGANELEFSYIRSSGPGGQNVNKVASAVQLRFDAANSSSLSAGVKTRLRAAAGSRMTRDGVIVITADSFRSQPLNQQNAVDRLVALIRSIATPPRPRKATRPTLASKKRRLDAKARRGSVKSLRQRKPDLQ